MTLSLPLRAQEPRFSLLSCSPGDEAYSLFGHTALRYCDEARQVDVVYNYGYFSFDAPNFAWRFILGQTDYLVASVPYRIFIQEYVERGSSVVEQVLGLNPLQVERLRRALEVNCLPANRVYRYNYFYKNCTTMARDMFVNALGDGYSLVYGNEPRQMTLRQALASYTHTHPWYSFGIDLLMGSDVDKATTREEYTMDKDDPYREIYDRITAYFDKSMPYLNSGLTIADIGRGVFSNKLYISKAISQYTGRNFCQFVNYHRVAYSVNLFRKNPDLNVTELANASGFNNVASFSTAFKLFMNENPSDWCRRERVLLIKGKNKLWNP